MNREVIKFQVFPTFHKRFDTSNVTNMSYMFYTSNLTSLNLSGFDTRKVTNFTKMFNSCQMLSSLDISSFDMSKNDARTNISASDMFYSCYRLKRLKAPANISENITISLPAGKTWYLDNDADCKDMFIDCNALKRLQASITIAGYTVRLPLLADEDNEKNFFSSSATTSSYIKF